MLDFKSKVFDVVLMPGEIVQFKDIQLDLNCGNSYLRYQFNIQLSIQEKYETIILELDCEDDIKGDNEVKALLNANIIKQFKIQIFSKKLAIPSGGYPIKSLIENLQKEYNKEICPIGGMDYREKIRLRFKVITVISNLMSEQVETLRNDFCYDIYFNDDEDGLERTLIIDNIQVDTI